MRATIVIDPDLKKELNRVQSLIREKQATVLRLALRAGLPIVASRFAAARPEGYFADCYPRPKDRRELQAAMAKVPQKRTR